MILRNKNGTASVFLVMICVTLIAMLLIFVQAARARALKSMVQALGNLWSDSIIAEYDINLKSRYDLFGFRTTADDVNYKIGKMAEYSFDDKRYVKNFNSDCELYEYSLALPKNFSKQIVTAGQMKRLNDSNRDSENTGPKRYIGNDVIWKSLPSIEVDVSRFAFDIKEILANIGSINEIINEGGERYFVNNYIDCFFKDSLSDKNLGDTYFSNEIEYLICGKKSDDKNEIAIRNRIVGIREVINMNYLKTDPEKNSALSVAAEVLTPGPESALTKQALMASWALAESYNDYKLLKNGKKISFVKSDMSWATDLESILNNTENGCVDTGVEGDNDYSDYLALLTYLMSEELLLLRIMDLIQINMCYLYDDTFLLKDCNVGVCVRINVNGKDYEFDSVY